MPANEKELGEVVSPVTTINKQLPYSLLQYYLLSLEFPLSSESEAVIR
jgi:hypothetical protein